MQSDEIKAGTSDIFTAVATVKHNDILSDINEGRGYIFGIHFNQISRRFLIKFNIFFVSKGL